MSRKLIQAMTQGLPRSIAIAITIAIMLIATLTHIPDTPVAHAASYNRANAVAYADRWAHDRNSSYPYFSNADCTNFASQVLEAGGLPQIPGDHNKDNVSLWFVYYDWFWGYQNSKTWSAANWMNDHFTWYNGSRFQYDSTGHSITNGDMVVIRWHTTDSPADYHVRVVVGTGRSEEFVPGGQYGRVGIFGLLANQHVTDRKRVILDDGFSADTTMWRWHVNG